MTYLLLEEIEIVMVITIKRRFAICRNLSKKEKKNCMFVQDLQFIYFTVSYLGHFEAYW